MATKKTTTKKKTTKKFTQDSTTGRIASPKRALTDKAGTMTQTVNKDNDGVRSDKGGTHKKSALPDSATRDPQDASYQATEPVIEVNNEPNLQAEAFHKTVAEAQDGEDITQKLDDTLRETSREPAQESLPAASDGVSAETEGEASPERKPCLVRRPTKSPDYTCLDEQQEAIETPHHFTDVQLSAILSDDNLCDNCREYNESV